MNLEGLWCDLESEPSNNFDKWVVRRLHPECGYDVRIGVQPGRSSRAVLVRVINTAISASVEYPASRGFDCREIVLDDCPRTHTTIGVFLTDQRFVDVFTSLVQDVLDHLAGVESDEQVVNSLLDRLKLWQWFMEKAGAEGLNADLQKGLYGELHFLREYLIPEIGTLSAIQAWTGPTGATQDFQWSHLACEVKVSTAKQHSKIRISNELQLDTRSVSRMWLYFMSLDCRPGGEETLLDIINSIHAILEVDVTAAERFSRSLLESGFHPTHSSLYEVNGYSIRNSMFFDIREGFPRLVETDLSPGVGDVTYSIAVSECLPFLMSADDVRALIRG